MFDNAGEVLATVETDRYGNANFIQDRDGIFFRTNISEPITGDRSGAGYAFTFTKSGTRIVTTTDFGVQVIHDRLHVRVRFSSSTYVNSVQGICGNHDGTKENDYQTADGIILPYHQAGSAFQCAKSWMIDGEDPASPDCFSKLEVYNSEQSHSRLGLTLF